MDRRYVHFGCGLCAPSSWRNFDASPTLQFERLPFVGQLYTKNGSRFPKNVDYGDIVKGLPVRDSSCAAVYCSHVLEHLALDDFRKALYNVHRMLEPEGVFRFVLPDLEQAVQDYLNDSTSGAALRFMRQTLLGTESRKRGLASFVCQWLGNSRHLWMWDFKSVESELCEVGFHNIRRAYYGDSEEPKFKAVEEEGRWNDCLGVECRRR